MIGFSSLGKNTSMSDPKILAIYLFLYLFIYLFFSIFEIDIFVKNTLLPIDSSFHHQGALGVPAV